MPAATASGAAYDDDGVAYQRRAADASWSSRRPVQQLAALIITPEWLSAKQIHCSSELGTRSPRQPAPPAEDILHEDMEAPPADLDEERGDGDVPEQHERPGQGGR